MNNKAILCVDDEEIVLSALESQFIKEFGSEYVIELAQSAEDAFEILDELKEEDFKLLVIVSDWLMPGMKGDEFLIEADEKFPKVLKVMLSGQADQKAIERSEEHIEKFKFINKPWDGAALSKFIRESVEEMS
ncbi:MAG: response regulator [Campylobacterales bacterium]